MIEKILSKIKLLKEISNFKNDSRFSHKNSSNVVLLLDTPRHNNLGDQAIRISEIDFLKNHLPQKVIIEFSYYECKYFIHIIKRYFKKSTIFIHGGGFIGSLWPNEHSVFMKILKFFKKHQIIVFPQTIYFSLENKIVEKKFFKVINRLKNIFICARENNTYNLLASQTAKEKIIFVPDIVLLLNYKIKMNTNKQKILLCFRDDCEKTINNKYITDFLEQNNIEYDSIDTVLKGSISLNQLEKYVFSTLNLFSKYSLVICNRLHAMIFSALSGTPCLVFDNINKKISGVYYSWMNKIKYIKLINESEICLDTIINLESNTSFKYPKNDIEKDFLPLINLIKTKVQ